MVWLEMFPNPKMIDKDFQGQIGFQYPKWYILLGKFCTIKQNKALPCPVPQLCFLSWRRWPLESKGGGTWSSMERWIKPSGSFKETISQACFIVGQVKRLIIKYCQRDLAFLLGATPLHLEFTTHNKSLPPFLFSQLSSFSFHHSYRAAIPF